MWYNSHHLWLVNKWSGLRSVRYAISDQKFVAFALQITIEKYVAFSEKYEQTSQHNTDNLFHVCAVLNRIGAIKNWKQKQDRKLMELEHVER